jgi:hypothetical protein
MLPRARESSVLENFQTSSWAHPASCLTETGVHFRIYGCHVMMSSTYLFLLPRLRMSGVRPLHPPKRFHSVDRNSFTFVNYSYTSSVACSLGLKTGFKTL